MFKKLAKTIICKTDNTFKTNLHSKAVNIVETWYNLNFLNIIRRNIDFAIVKFKYKLGIKNKTPLKLHLGCGDKNFEGYVNIDWRKTRATDLVCNIRKLPYPDNSIELIETYHAIEHLPRHDLPKALKEWDRVLFPGGRLIIECPDFDEIVKRYLEGDEKQLDGIFALQRFEGDYHLFGYNFKRLRRVLKDRGFANIEKKDAQDYHVKEWPCLRVECIKEHVSSSPHAEEKLQFRFTGERVVEDNTPQRIWLDHVTRYKLAGKYVKRKEVLDISCGTGYGSRILYDSKAAKVIGADISSKTIDFARTKYEKNGLEFKVGNILDIDFPENYFDVITCFETIEHVQDQEKALMELQRVLKSEGLLFISSPNRKLTSPGKLISDHPDNPFHTKEYSTKEFVRILVKYFDVNGLYGQRPINKVLLIPYFEKVLRRYLSQLYSPEAGSPLVEKCRPTLEYRYIIASCINSKK